MIKYQNPTFTYNKYQIQFNMENANQEKESLLAPITTSSHVNTLTKKRLGLDMNNLIGVALQEMRDICNKLQISPQALKKNLCVDINSKKLKVMEESMNKINLLLQNRVKIVAVFDGAKTQKIKQLPNLLIQQMGPQKIGQNEVLAYLKGGFVLGYLFKKRQYNILQSKLYWQFYQETIQYIILNLKKLEKKGVEIFVAPYQADIQLAKLFQLGFIDFVVSNDKDFINRGIPLISKLEVKGTFHLINVSAAELNENRFKHPYKFIKLAKENPIKRAMFSALSGSKHLSKLKTFNNKPITIPLLIQLIETSQNLKGVFNKLKQKYTHFQIPNYYQELAQLTMILELLSPFFNPSSEKIESSNPQIFEIIKDRQLNIEQLHIIWNQYYTCEVRKGFVNINTNQLRISTQSYFG